MLTGIRLQAHPTDHQKKLLSQWMGCARYIWNEKCRHDKEQRQHLAKEGKFPAVDQTYSQYKNKETTPWLFNCPSPILRNSVANWYTTYQNFFKKRCGRPNHKKKDGTGTIHLTQELFQFIKGEDGVTRLFIGSKTNNIGFLSLKNHRNYRLPNSIYIKKKHNQYSVSFCYEAQKKEPTLSQKEQLASLRKQGQVHLENHLIGLDRGVVVPLQTSEGNRSFDLAPAEKASKQALEKQIKRYQKKLSRQLKSSNRRYRTKIRLSKRHQQLANLRKNFCHQTSCKLVNNPEAQVFIFEHLRTKQMTRKPKAKQAENGKWLNNNRSAKAGLNKAILDKSWHLLEQFTNYKAQKLGKAVFKIAAQHTSQECAHCHHIHPTNRKSQAKFLCVKCGHTDNADYNAAKVIKQRAIQLILNSGTELSARGVLSLPDSGRGADLRRKKSIKATCAVA